MRKNFFKLMLLAGAAALAFVSCSKDEEKVKNPVANFTYVIKDGTVTLTNTSTDATIYLWEFGDGLTSDEMSTSHEYLKLGNYEVKLTALGTEGTTASTKTITINITTLPVNLLLGGGMETADASFWTVLTTTKDGDIASPANYKFGETTNSPSLGVGGGLGVSDKVAGSKSTEGSIFFQSVTLKPGKYKWDAEIKISTGTDKDHASNTSAFLQSWFEVCLDTIVPKEFDGYDKGLMLNGFNWWVAQAPAKDIPMVDGSFTKAAQPFDQIAKIRLDKINIDGLDMPNKEGKFTITEEAKYYFCIKIGKYLGRYGDGGIVIDHVRINKLD